MNKENIIKLTNISKKYNDKEVLKNVNFSINEKDYISIIGPSGSGKTTLLNIVGLISGKTDSGTVEVYKENIEHKSDEEISLIRKENLGFVFQNYHLIEGLDVKDNILSSFFGVKISNSEINEVLSQLNLVGFNNIKVKNLSGGEKQRVSIARAMAKKPKLLIADEPTGNLDQENTNIVMHLFEKLNQQGIAILLVTHDNRLALKAKKRYKIENGELHEYD